MDFYRELGSPDGKLYLENNVVEAEPEGAVRPWAIGFFGEDRRALFLLIPVRRHR